MADEPRRVARKVQLQLVNGETRSVRHEFTANDNNLKAELRLFLRDGIWDQQSLTYYPEASIVYATVYELDANDGAPAVAAIGVGQGTNWNV